MVAVMIDIMQHSTSEFTDIHRRILDFERAWWKYSGAKMQAVRSYFGMDWIRYAQVLDWVIDQPEALVHDAQMVNRLRRLRDQRAGGRNARRDGFDIAS